MTLNFNLNDVTHAEFGVGRTSPPMFYCVPVARAVQTTLIAMARKTVELMADSSDDDARYEPAEKYGSMEYCYLKATDPMAQIFHDVATASNLSVDASFPKGLDTVTCYFARFTDREGRQLAGFRRATQFKMLRKPPILRWDDNALRPTEGAMFKLDQDFDVLIDSDRLHVLRPRGLETMGRLKDSILAAVESNVALIVNEIPGIDLGSVASYAGTRIRAARYIAGICQRGLQKIDLDALMDQCNATGVTIEGANGRHVLSEAEVMGFLEVLDRRRFSVELIRGSQEVYRAASRRKVSAKQ